MARQKPRSCGKLLLARSRGRQPVTQVSRVTTMALKPAASARPSAAGWALYDGLARAGAWAGFVDLDQLGLSVSVAADLVSRRW